MRSIVYFSRLQAEGSTGAALKVSQGSFCGVRRAGADTGYLSSLDFLLFHPVEAAWFG